MPPACEANFVIVATVRLSYPDRLTRPKTGLRTIKSWMDVEGVLHDPDELADVRLTLNEKEGRSEQPDFERGQRWLLFMRRLPGRPGADYWHWIPLTTEGSVPGDAALRRLYGTGCGP